MSTQDTAALVESVNKMTDTVAGKMGEIDKRVEEAEDSFESFKGEADARYALQTRRTTGLRVDGDQNFWYPVVFSQPNGAEFFLRRYAHADAGVYGQWNGSLEFMFKANDPEYGGNVGFLIVDRYLVGGKGPSRILPDADIPYIGRLSSSAGPYGVAVYLRGNTSYELGCDVSGYEPTVYYESTETVAGYSTLAPIPVSDGVHPSVQEVGYIRGDV